MTAALGACASGPGRAASGAKAPSTFVLVHGAWHGAWCYQRVTARLTALGHRVYAPTLTGLADRGHLLSPAVELATHVEDVKRLIQWEDLDSVVLVGHSYGGMVVTGAAQALGSTRIGSLVYLDAYMPLAGESLMSIAGDGVEAALDKAAASNGGHYLAPIPAKAFAVNEKDIALVDAKCTLHPYRTFKGTFASVDNAARIAKKTYVRTQKYASASLDKMATRCKQSGFVSLDIATGHDLMLDDPARTTEILLAAA
jgi:pimeloyl-ACP methyl ester carboxylesterase